VKIKINIAGLGRSKWYEYAGRFLFGGIVTALAGIIAKRWGPGIGGLFLAFPAIFPAAATLLEKHEDEKRQSVGKGGTLRARAIAGVDAAGAAMGSIGLLAFAMVVWRLIPNHRLAMVLGIAAFVWLSAAVLTWEIHETIWRRLRVRFFRTAKPSVEHRHP
jgi:Protein of unknown function (DUF3147)